MEVITKSAKETKKFGQRVADKIGGKGAIIALIGNLGAGKTTFTQGFASGLGIKKRIISPTFILMRKYEDFYHVDLYRLEDDVEKEVTNLGLTDIWGKNGNVVLIEWAEKIEGILPKDTIRIEFETLSEDERKIVVKY